MWSPFVCSLLNTAFFSLRFSTAFTAVMTGRCNTRVFGQLKNASGSTIQARESSSASFAKSFVESDLGRIGGGLSASKKRSGSKPGIDRDIRVQWLQKGQKQALTVSSHPEESLSAEFQM